MDRYQQLVGAIKDESFIYWDIRLPAKVPTIEFRGADVMTRVEETVGYVGLVRAMVMTAIDEERRDAPFKNIHPNILSYALWHSARFGVSDQLIDPAAGDKIAVANMADRVFDGLNGALQRSGERECVDRFVQNALQHGTGADRQRQIGDLILAVQIVIAETVPAASIAAPQAC
ncbi:Carboxylate-amine ligase YbdK [Stieleria maiorica]|uniref:Carboxylate-amine ligase YbdK n=1 Tax=Stieleria maiorica TaxID=2795974 RepID=A0A5B9MG27_9BACT|nr:hypothetical protein [Stieleria maiorica]QEG00223.1 Carboxylate-amine ligase YbdK [Stieleria maiorica]